jgi:D-glycero-D-manno-heptose 1,7-bisphosphate phosphatase
MLVILDRDGVINEDLPTGVQSLSAFRFLEGACEAIAELTQAGHTLVIATNQSVVGKGLVSEKLLEEIHQEMCSAITKSGGSISKIYVATDAPNTPSLRRKPEAGMLYEAMQDFAATPENTVMIGDALRDIEAAHKAGVRAMLVATGKGHDTQKALPPHLASTVFVENLYEAAKLLLASTTKAV